MDPRRRAEDGGGAAGGVEAGGGAASSSGWGRERNEMGRPGELGLPTAVFFFDKLECGLIPAKQEGFFCKRAIGTDVASAFLATPPRNNVDRCGKAKLAWSLIKLIHI